MNPRALLLAALSLIGAVVSAYLLTVHWGWWSAVCLGVGDCELVNTSRYSEFLGIPVASIGIGGYVAIFALSLAQLRNVYAETARRIVFVAAMIGVAFSAYLTYIELVILKEICPWCVLSAVLILLIASVSAMELRAEHVYESSS